MLSQQSPPVGGFSRHFLQKDMLASFFTQKFGFEKSFFKNKSEWKVHRISGHITQSSPSLTPSSPWLGRTNSVAGDVHVYARRYVRSCDPLWVTISRPGSIGDDGGSRVVRPGTFPHWWSWGSKP